MDYIIQLVLTFLCIQFIYHTGDFTPH